MEVYFLGGFILHPLKVRSWAALVRWVGFEWEEKGGVGKKAVEAARLHLFTRIIFSLALTMKMLMLVMVILLIQLRIFTKHRA